MEVEHANEANLARGYGGLGTRGGILTGNPAAEALLQTAVKILGGGEQPLRKEMTTEEKQREMEELESMIKDPEQCRKIVKIIKLVTPDIKRYTKVVPNFIEIKLKTAIKKKKAKAALTKDQKESIKKVSLKCNSIVGS